MLFEAITSDTIEIAKTTIKRDLELYFPRVIINELNLKAYPSQNLVNFQLKYSVSETNIVDEVSINFEQ